MIVTRDWLWLFEVCVDKLLIEGTLSCADIAFSLLFFNFCPLSVGLLIFGGVVCFSKPDKRYSMYLALNTEHMLQLFVSLFLCLSHVGDTKEAHKEV